MVMRILQKEYFKIRDPLVLVRAKAAEKKVDDYLKEREQDKNSQQSLF